MKKISIFLLSIALVVVVGYVISTLRLYPVAIVGGKWLSAGAFEKEYAAAQLYAERLKVVYGTSSLPTDEAALYHDLRRSTLDTLIEDAIIQEEMNASLGASQVSRAVSTRLGAATTTVSLSQQVQTLYGLNMKDFSQLVLEPQARRDLLADELRKQGVLLNDWLVSRRRAAEVSIFTPEFVWKNGAVENR